jgi:hypothetical protein
MVLVFSSHHSIAVHSTRHFPRHNKKQGKLDKPDALHASFHPETLLKITVSGK